MVNIYSITQDGVRYEFFFSTHSRPQSENTVIEDDAEVIVDQL